jgi:nondiscriminating glutamyl-tRNA synthetase
MVRTRFAPSPTGEFHVGSARTALFNWLYARRHGGAFVLRLEDTDAARNTPEARAAIFDSLSWLGLDWDEGPLLRQGSGGQACSEGNSSKGDFGPYCQSERGDIYQGHIERLLSEGKAYEDDGAVRFRMPGESIRVKDLICGEIDFDLSDQDDLVIRRSNGAPVFHLVNVVDDLEMGITHVLRGEDHLSNTPKHIALYQGLGAQAPQFAHIPLILNANGSKMSKRDEGAIISEYRRRGFLPEAVVNYLCLLGWSPQEDGKEIFTLTEVAAEFELTDINRSNARFDPEKLLWMNGDYSRRQEAGSIRRFNPGADARSRSPVPPGP